MTLLELLSVLAIILLPLFFLKFIAIGKDVQAVGESLTNHSWIVRGGNSLWINRYGGMLVIPQNSKDGNVYMNYRGRSRVLSFTESVYIRYKATQALEIKRKEKTY